MNGDQIEGSYRRGEEGANEMEGSRGTEMRRRSVHIYLSARRGGDQ